MNFIYLLFGYDVKERERMDKEYKAAFEAILESRKDVGRFQRQVDSFLNFYYEAVNK